MTRFASAEIDATHPHVQYTEWIEHGYGIAHVTEQQVTLEYRWTPLTRAPHSRNSGYNCVSLAATSS